MAPLFYISPTQINFLVPQALANGTCTFTVIKSDMTAPSGATQIIAVAPALFAANANGQGVAAGLILRVKANGSRNFEPVMQFNPAQNNWAPLPIDFGPTTDDLYLVLFGTGVRFRSSLNGASLRINSVEIPVLFAGPQGYFEGLDQINARLPRNLAGIGESSVKLTVDGAEANPTIINFK